MSRLSRRGLLRIAGGAGLAGLAGCTVLSDESSKTPRFGYLSVGNYDLRSYTVHVVVLESSEPVYWRTREATAGSEAPTSGEVSPGGVELEGYPTDPGNYELHVRLDGDPRSAWRTLDFGEYDVSCIGVSIRIGYRGSANAGELSIWTGTNPRICEESW